MYVFIKPFIPQALTNALTELSSSGIVELQLQELDLSKNKIENTGARIMEHLLLVS